MKKRIKYLLVAVLSLGVLGSCSEEDLDPTLQQEKDVDQSVNTVNDLQSVINGAYNRVSSYTYYGRDFLVLGDVFSDNAASINNSNRFVDESRMDLLPTSETALTLWTQAYAVIGSANIVINAEDIEGNEQEINQIKGQAYALRALAHFDLVKFYGQQHVEGGGLSAPGVPYVTSFRDQDALFPPRNSVQEVRDMAYADLETAAGLMDDRVTNVFLSVYAVKAIEARMATYFGDWSRALSAAEFVIDSNQFSIVETDSFISSFANAGGENSIFEIAASETDNQNIDGIANMYLNTSYGDVVALPNLVAIYEENDVRGLEGIITVDSEGNYRNTGKFPSIAPYDDNIQVIRYAEVILIYAEALLETGNTAKALEYLNMIPENRSASAYTAATKENILLERRKELAFEGFRFHDLARNQMDIPFVDITIQTHKGPAYGDYNFALPIPLAEVDANSNVPQNAGY